MSEQPPIKQRCPRRSEIGSVFILPDEDTWDAENRCSYCGSLHPDVFMAKAMAGVQLGPTDKNYKIYVGGVGDPLGKFYFQHLSEDQRRSFVDLMNGSNGKPLLNLDEPFYVLPFFVRKEEASK